MLRTARSVAVAVLTAALLVVQLQSASSQQERATQTQTSSAHCVFRWYTGPHSPPSTTAVFRMATCFAERFGTSPAEAKSVLSCESHGYAYAVNGPYLGAWQRTRTEHRRAWHAIAGWVLVRGRPGVFNARAETAATIFEAAHRGWGYSSCA